MNTYILYHQKNVTCKGLEILSIGDTCLLFGSWVCHRPGRQKLILVLKRSWFWSAVFLHFTACPRASLPSLKSDPHEALFIFFLNEEMKNKGHEVVPRSVLVSPWREASTLGVLWIPPSPDRKLLLRSNLSLLLQIKAVSSYLNLSRRGASYSIIVLGLLE